MKCYNCLADLPEGADICPRCGQRQRPEPGTISAAIHGDPLAMDDLYQMSCRAVTGMLRRKIRDEDVRLDLAQETYLRAFMHLEQLQDPDKFVPWVKRIAFNLAMDYHRKQQAARRKAPVLTESVEDLEIEDVRPNLLPENVLDREETQRLLNEMLDALPEEQRICLILYYVEEMSTGEIAEELGVPVATVKSRLNYAKRKLQSMQADMEKRGIDLRGLAPVAFLLMLVQSERVEASVPEAEVLRQRIRAELPGSGETSHPPAEKPSVPRAETAPSGSGTAASEEIPHPGAGTSVIGGGASASPASFLASHWIPVAAAVLLAAGGGTYLVSRGMQPVPVTESAAQMASEERAAGEAGELAAEREVQQEAEAPSADAAPLPAKEPLIPAEESTGEPAETEPAETSVQAISALDAYRGILEDYRDLVKNGVAEDSPYRYYEFPQYVLEYEEPFLYICRDLNGDGTEELVLFLWAGYEGVFYYRPFEVYAFDGSKAVPLFPDVFREGVQNLHVESGGTFRVDAGNGGYSDVDFYVLPDHAAALERTAHYTAIDYTVSGWGEQRYDGPEGTISGDEFEALHPREDLFSEEDYCGLEEDLSE